MEFIKDNKALFDAFRVKYPYFSYEKYGWKINGNKLSLNFLYKFGDDLPIDSVIDIDLPEMVKESELINYESYIFNIGLINALSYWKAYCSPNFEIKCGYLNDEQIKWWIDLWYDGLGEFRYRNGLMDVNKNEWVNIKCDNTNELKYRPVADSFLSGNLIAFTGGKDSSLVLGVMRDSGEKINEIFTINPSIESSQIKKDLGVDSYKETLVYRSVSDKLLEINKSGALNGHTPFSAVVSFVGIFVAHIRCLKYFLVGNESSANEPTVPGLDINHQYSKSITFEKNFQDYCKMVWLDSPFYVSLLRPLTEIGIACMLRQYKVIMPHITSCNIKKRDTLWCGECSKCLFAFMLFSGVWDTDFATKIIGKNMLADGNKTEMLYELLGLSLNKPFECIGTTKESQAIISKIINKEPDYQSSIFNDLKIKHQDILLQVDMFDKIAKEFHLHLLPPHLELIIKNAHNKLI